MQSIDIILRRIAIGVLIAAALTGLFMRCEYSRIHNSFYRTHIYHVR